MNLKKQKRESKMNINAVHGCTSGPHGCSICHPCFEGCGCQKTNLQPTKQCTHCWHPAEFTHAIYVPNGHHADEKCCFCGASQCYSKFNRNDQFRHGPFAGNNLNSQLEI
jgi:hypothetical protein